MSEIDNTGFLEEVARDRRRREEVLTRPTSQYNLSNMRLPRPHKAAFTSAELFAQQQSITTFDFGLRELLDTLGHFVNEYRGVRIPLNEFVFTMNFGGLQTETTKQFVCNLRLPVQAHIELTCRYENMQLCWDIDYTFQGQVPGRVEDFRPGQPPRRSQQPVREEFSNREERGIDVDE